MTTVPARTASLLLPWVAVALGACGNSVGQERAGGARIYEPVVGHADPLSQIESQYPELLANKRLVFDMWRSIVNAGHVELADRMLTEDYTQHSPLLPTGRDAFKTIFSAVPRREEIAELVAPPLVSLVAEGDLVVMALVERLQEPDGSDVHTSTHFNLFRVESGQLAEHWHSLQGPPGPEVLPPEQGGPQRVTGKSGPEQLPLLEASDTRLAANKRLVFDFWREVVDGGREALAAHYLAADYVEHDPRAAAGGPAFEAHFPPGRELPVAEFVRDPLVAIVAERDLVVLALKLEHPHPHRAGETYTSTWFEMFRVGDGMLKEHWNGAARSARARPQY